jgi:hypothetical protein
MTKRVDMKRDLSTVLASLLAVALPACATESSTDGPSAGDPNETFTRTMVHLHADGTMDVTVGRVTRAEQLRERRVRENGGTEPADRGPGAWADPPPTGGWPPPKLCDGADFKAYDLQHLIGNELCLWGAGTHYLYQYRRGSSNWAHAVRSYDSAVYSGRFHRTVVNCAHFDEHTLHGLVSSCEADATAVDLEYEDSCARCSECATDLCGDR